MTGVCGWVGSAPPSSEALLDSMANMLSATAGRPDVKVIHSNNASAGDAAKIEDAIVAAISGKAYWTLPELQQLSDQYGQADALIQAFRRYDSQLLDYLRGTFVFALFDQSKQRFIAAIDRMGRQSLYYSTANDVLVYASTALSVKQHPQISATITEQGIFDYVYFHMIPSPHSIYSNIQKLPAGHYLDYQAGQAKIKSYWQPAFTETSAANNQALAQQLREIILTSVKNYSSLDQVGAFLSGGLDSSTVAGMLAQARPDDAHTFSIGFDAEGYDEMAYARIAVNRFNTHQHEYYVTPDDVVNAIPEIARSYDEPFGNSSAVPTYYCAKLAAENGIKCMLAGDGGDELFAGNERYAKQGVFEFYQRLPGFFRRFAIEPVVSRLPNRLPLAGKAKSYIDQASISLPDRLQSYNFLHRTAHQQIFRPEFLAVINPELPLHLLREQYQRPEKCSTLNRMLYLDWQFTLADNDLRKVNRMCALHNVEVVYPLLADDLIDFSCRIPSRLKLSGQNLRYFYKQAMQDFLPDEIINKSKHGFGLPFGVWMRSHKPLREMGYDSLLALKRRHYFQADFLEQAIQLHQSDHAAYYGELIWILMMLELWLQAHQ